MILRIISAGKRVTMPPPFSRANLANDSRTRIESNRSMTFRIFKRGTAGSRHD